MIKPTIGRVVWIRNRPETIDALQPEVALVTYVHSDTNVNVAGFDANGDPFKLTSLFLKPDDYKEADAPSFQHAEWMPYQKGQAAKTEQLESRLGSVEQGFTKP
jgi:hypothetical protein